MNGVMPDPTEYWFVEKLAWHETTKRGDYVIAFRRYQEIFAPLVAGKQKAALQFGNTFAPKSKLWLFVRNQLIKLLRIPWAADIAIARTPGQSLTAQY